MKKIRLYLIFILFVSLFPNTLFGQIDELNIEEDTVENKSVSILFLGDIMQHDLQIESAYKKETNSYDFSSQFKYVKPIFDTTDVVVGNLEVTFGGPPYKGYPRFTSPDALAYDIKKSGINYLVTANNHVYDKGKAGFERTMKLLDSVGFKRTGTFIDSEDKKKNHPMVIEENDLKIALFNYTYGLNGNVPLKPSIINTLNTDSIKKDMIEAKQSDFDAIIVKLHWGVEYKRHPNAQQISLANICFENGADIVIGSHPHVIQRMEHKTYKNKFGEEKDVLVAYSLGNFVSNYGNWRYCDGGAMVRFNISKDESGKLKIFDPVYHLIWVYREPRGSKLKNYYVLPITDFEKDNDLKEADKKQMKVFIDDSRSLYKANNLNVPEFKK